MEVVWPSCDHGDSPSQVPARSLEPAPHGVAAGSSWGRSSGAGEGAPDDGSGRETSLCESLVVLWWWRGLPRLGRVDVLAHVGERLAVVVLPGGDPVRVPDLHAVE